MSDELDSLREMGLSWDGEEYSEASRSVVSESLDEEGLVCDSLPESGNSSDEASKSAVVNTEIDISQLA